MTRGSRDGRVALFVAVASRAGAYGGPYDVAVRQAEILRGLGADVTVFAGAKRGDEPEVTGLATATVRHLLGRASFIDVMSWSLVRLAWRIAREADTVHVAIAREPGPLMVAWFAMIRGRRLSLQPHGMLTSRDSWMHRSIDRLLIAPLARRSTLVALTEQEKCDLASRRALGARTILVVPNPPLRGAAALGPSQAESGSPMALFAARLHPRKRVIDFAEAAGVAASRGWNERYVVLGPEGGQLKELVAKAEKLDNLEYRGSTDSAGVLQAIRAASVFVLPSLREPWGVAMVSALCCGVPVVVTRSAALAPLIAGSGAGIVVDDCRPDAIAEAVHSLGDEATHRAASNAAAALAARLFSEQVVGRELFNAIAAGGRP